MPIKFDLSKHRHNRIFIETGTYKGDGVKLALKAGFDIVCSIEIDLKRCQENMVRFKDNNNVFLYHGDSSVVLNEILNEIDEPCTFWLDAHYDYDGSTRGKELTPIRTELDIICNHSIKNHVILIDDLRDFDRFKHYPGISYTLKKIKEINKDYEIEYLEGIIKNDVLKAYIK